MSIQNENVMFTCWQCSQYVCSHLFDSCRKNTILCLLFPTLDPSSGNKGNSPRGQVVAFSFTAWNVPWSWNRYPVLGSATGRVDRTLSRCHWPGETSRVQVKPPKPVGYPVQAPFYTTAVPVNYITSLRVFTDSTSSSTGRIRARFGGSFHSRNRRHRWRRHFLRVRQYW